MLSSPVPHSRARAGISTLPTEVLDVIFEFLDSDLIAGDPLTTRAQGARETSYGSAQPPAKERGDDPHGIARDKRRRRTLASLCLSCKTLAAAATPRLYQRVYLSRATAAAPAASSPPGSTGSSTAAADASGPRSQQIRLTADGPALLLRTLLEDGSTGRIARLVRDVQCFVLLRQQHVYRQGPGAVDDVGGISMSWSAVAPTVRMDPLLPRREDESLQKRVLRHVGLWDGTKGKWATAAAECLPERVVAAILMLCTQLSRVTLLCPPWHSSCGGQTGWYSILDGLLRGAYEERHLGLDRTTLRYLRSVEFTGMAGVGGAVCDSSSRTEDSSTEPNGDKDEVFNEDVFPRAYLACGDACPALALGPAVEEITTHGMRGGWFEFMNVDDDDDNDDDDTVHHRLRSPLRRIHIGSPAPDRELVAVSHLGAFRDLTRLRQPDTLHALAVSQPHYATSTAVALLKGTTSLSLSICDRTLARHAVSLQSVDLGTCWDLAAPAPAAWMVGGGVVGMSTGPVVRPSGVLGLLVGVEELCVPLPLLATNRELWRFWRMGVADMEQIAVSGMEFADAVNAVLFGEGGDVDVEAATTTTATTIRPADPEDRVHALGETAGADGRDWQHELPFLRNIPRSVRQLRITDYHAVHRSPYWARAGEYGSGNGIPDFTGRLAAARSPSPPSSTPEHEYDNTDKGDAGGALAILEALAATETEHTGELITAVDVDAQVNRSSDLTPRVEFAHKTLLPLALRRLADILCGSTGEGKMHYKQLERIVVEVDRPLLQYYTEDREGETPAEGDGSFVRWYSADQLMHGASELKVLFGRAGVVFDVVGNPGRADSALC